MGISCKDVGMSWHHKILERIMGICELKIPCILNDNVLWILKPLFKNRSGVYWLLLRFATNWKLFWMSIAFRTQSPDFVWQLAENNDWRQSMPLIVNCTNLVNHLKPGILLLLKCWTCWNPLFLVHVVGQNLCHLISDPLYQETVKCGYSP